MLELIPFSAATYWLNYTAHNAVCAGAAMGDVARAMAPYLAHVEANREAFERAKAAAGHMVKIELEVDTLAQLEEALAVGVDAVLLDNMSPAQLREAVAMVGGRALTEASGRVTAATASAIAATGVDLISIGWLTHSAPILDIGLDYRA